MDLKERCNALEAVCNPEGQNLHFGPSVLAAPAVLEELYDIGRRAWHAVRRHPSWGAAFWFYDWFLLVANVCLQIWRDRTQQDYTQVLVGRLALLVLDISQMTMKQEYEGDIQKRHYEAFVHVLLAFGESHRLMDVVVTSAKKTGDENVIRLVLGSIADVQRIERKTREPGAESGA